VTEHDRLTNVVWALVTHRKPETQGECCRISAIAAVALMDTRPTGRQLIDMAAGMSKSLFGDGAYEKAGEAQRWEWIDACEAELRAAVEARAWRRA